MDDSVRTVLGRSQVIDITTTGRRSGEPRRLEIFLHNLDGRLVVSGMPNPDRTRAWLHNLEADPSISIHLKKGGVAADLPGTARIVTDPAERRQLLKGVATNWGRTDLDVMQEHSPLIEVTVEGYPA
jgi:deazaflavin-dependent oxidoreductase (nitroreductase family)